MNVTLDKLLIYVHAYNSVFSLLVCRLTHQTLLKTQYN